MALQPTTRHYAVCDAVTFTMISKNSTHTVQPARLQTSSPVLQVRKQRTLSNILSFCDANNKGIICRRKSSYRQLKFTWYTAKEAKYKTFVHLLPEQVNPSPEYPSWQVQVKPPGAVRVQYACELQLFTSHSSTSVMTQRRAQHEDYKNV